MTPAADEPAIDNANLHARLADDFARLHDKPALVLPNAWDVASARIIEDAGAYAIATTSAGVAWALGAADGNQLDRGRAMDALARITAAVGVPVTADIETGFGASDDELAETVRAVLRTGAVGINIEDSGFAPLRPMAEQAERLAVVRATAEAAGRSLFVNARIDTFLMAAGQPEDRLAETLRRSEAYLAAGADGIFVPGVVKRDVLRQLVEGIPAPLNVLTGPGAPRIPELVDLGVRRISVGSSIAAAAYSLVGQAARELLSTGTYDALTGGELDYGKINALVGLRPPALG